MSENDNVAKHMYEKIKNFIEVLVSEVENISEDEENVVEVAVNEDKKTKVEEQQVKTNIFFFPIICISSLQEFHDMIAE